MMQSPRGRVFVFDHRLSIEHTDHSLLLPIPVLRRSFYVFSAQPSVLRTLVSELSDAAEGFAMEVADPEPPDGLEMFLRSVAFMFGEVVLGIFFVTLHHHPVTVTLAMMEAPATE